MLRRSLLSIECASTNHQRGFTLIETVVALVVLAIGASVILQQLRAMVSRVEHEQAAVLEAMTLLNAGVRLPHLSIERRQLIWTREGDGLFAQRLTLTWPDMIGAMPARVLNFTLLKAPVPPLDLAFTPGQLQVLTQGRYTLSLTAPAVLLPKATEQEAVDSSKVVAVRNAGREEEKARQEAAIAAGTATKPPDSNATADTGTIRPPASGDAALPLPSISPSPEPDIPGNIQNQVIKQ